MILEGLSHSISRRQVSLLWSLALILAVADAFQCHSCSFSYDPEKPEADNACVIQPEIFTGHQVLKCEHNCVVQETYNRRLRRVVAYWRSCIDKDYAGHCNGDATSELVTCFYTCAGDLCNSWARGQLHQVFAGVKSHAGPQGSYDGGGADKSRNGCREAASSFSSFPFVFLNFCAIFFTNVMSF